jgi:hypothetical protein
MLQWSNPIHLLDKLVADVSVDKYQEYSQKPKRERRSDENPTIEILQIGISSFESGDIHTGINATESLETATKQLITDSSNSGDFDSLDYREIFTYWDRLGQVAAEDGTESARKTFAESQSNIVRTVASRGSLDNKSCSVAGRSARTLQRFCISLYQNRDLNLEYREFRTFLEQGFWNPKMAKACLWEAYPVAAKVRRGMQETDKNPQYEKQSSEVNSHSTAIFSRLLYNLTILTNITN